MKIRIHIFFNVTWIDVYNKNFLKKDSKTILKDESTRR